MGRKRHIHRRRDFNAHVGGGEEMDGVKGKFGLRESNMRGRDLIRWCEENSLAYVNSFLTIRKEEHGSTEC